jgi:methionyl-tRNA synthetase
MHSFGDSDFTMEKFKEAYNADLANGLGNLTARIMQLAQTHLEKPVELPTLEWPEAFKVEIERFDIMRAMDSVAASIASLDQKINATEPFKLVKTDKEKGKALIAELVVELAKILRPLEPIIPEKGHIIWMAIKENKKPENLFPRKE